MLRSLWVGVLIAIPSGAGVALSLLGGNTGSLVGVAISASLLPPAVNAVSSILTTAQRLLWSHVEQQHAIGKCYIPVDVLVQVSLLQGMLWAYAIVSTIIHPDWAETHKPVYDADYVSQVSMTVFNFSCL